MEDYIFFFFLFSQYLIHLAKLFLDFSDLIFDNVVYFDCVSTCSSLSQLLISFLLLFSNGIDPLLYRIFNDCKLVVIPLLSLSLQVIIYETIHLKKLDSYHSSSHRRGGTVSYEGFASSSAVDLNLHSFLLGVSAWFSILFYIK